MKNRELIEHLQKLDPEMVVYTAIDAEGNGYNEVYFEPTVMVAVKTNHGVEIMNDDEDELDDSGYDESDFQRVIVI